MANYEEARVKLTNTQLNKYNPAAKNNTGATLRITENNVQDEELPHELFLTIRQKTKVRNTFPRNMSPDIKLSKSQLAKIIQSGGFPGKTLGNIKSNLSTKALLDIAFPLVKDALPKLATKETSFVLDKSERKINGCGALRAEKVFTLFIFK